MNSLPKLAVYSIAIGITVATLFSSGTPVLIVFMSSLALLYWLSRGDFNTQAVIAIVFCLSTLELALTIPFEQYVYAQYSGFVENNVIFSIHLFADILIAYSISQRRAISLLLFGRHSHHNRAEIFKHSLVDAPLYGLFMVFCMVDLLAILENLLRNLEHIGFTEEFAKQFWHIQYLYGSYSYIKSVLLACVVLTFSAVVIINRRGKKLKAEAT